MRPSAGYIGRGVTVTSADEYIANHQERFAQVMSAASHTFGACTSRLDCCHRRTSIVSRNSQPLPTAPCPLGSRPVR